MKPGAVTGVHLTMRPLSLEIAVRGLALVFLAALLAGCSAARLAYSQLDQLLAWRVEEYVTLNPAQRAWLDARLQAHLAWHCRTQLPAYADWLRSLRAELERATPDSARLDDHARRVERFFDAVLEAVAPTAAELLVRLDASQRAELFARLDERIAEARAEYVDPPPDRQQRVRAERLESRLKPWLGALTPAQVARIRQWSAALGDRNAGWLASRQRLLAEVRAALAGPDVAGARPHLVRLLRAPDSAHTEEDHRRIAHGRAEAIALGADLLRLSTAAQRLQLQRRIDGWAAEFDAMKCAERAVAATAGDPIPSRLDRSRRPRPAVAFDDLAFVMR